MPAGLPSLARPDLVALALDAPFLRDLGLILIGAAVLALAARLLRLPLILAYLAAGLALGPVSGLLASSDALETIAEAGIVLLLFLVGLELTIDRIRSVGGRAALLGVAQIALTLPGALVLSVALGYPPTEAGVLAVGLTLSSTVVVVKRLVETGTSHTLAGQSALGVLLVQDLFVIVLLTILSGLGPETAMTPGVVAASAAKALGAMAAICAALFVLARFVLPRPFLWASRSRETVFVASVAWCFIVVLGVHQLHLSAEIGAFLAGVSLAQLPHAHDLQRRVTPLMNCFIAVFFVGLGAALQFEAGIGFWIKVAALSVFVIAGKFVILGLLTRWLRFPGRPAFDLSLSLTQVSEFSFIFAAAAVAAGLADQALASLLATVGIVTIASSSLLPKFAERLFALYRRSPLAGAGADRGEAPEAPDPAPPGRGAILIVGMNTLGRELSRRLHERGEDVVAIDTDPRKLTDLSCRTVEGDAATPSVLHEAGLSTARLLVSTLHIVDTNELLAYRARAAGVTFSAHAPEPRNIEPLIDLGAAYVMAPKVDSLKLLRRTLREQGLLGTSGKP